ncbi:serine/threonine-protein kinase [Nannocystis punicea]|uniref:Serine/threonine-protein kinase n=1 Tax=Nannocystis punicea TaxID=2995304 RepID=A0ABY7GVJ0_9BACT|nr:serine/threonine-protein kinase [Nannocystis poenicansa]WAS90919.1 serine/threonine-protein kinase [Nannocystis poenicansa]
MPALSLEAPRRSGPGAWTLPGRVACSARVASGARTTRVCSIQTGQLNPDTRSRPGEQGADASDKDTVGDAGTPRSERAGPSGSTPVAKGDDDGDGDATPPPPAPLRPELGEPLGKQLLKRALFPNRSQPVQLGRYTVLHVIGQGGMGVVYACYDDQLDRKVAVKVLQRGRVREQENAHGRLLREAQAMARLSHPNIVTVHEVGQADGMVYVAMEFVRGSSLEAWVKESRSWQEILATFLQAGRGLAAAHKAGLVHRDFKPQNVMLGDDGQVKVLDFGLARLNAGDLREEGPDAAPTGPESEASLLLRPLTRTGVIVGTPAYMSPEQHLGERATAESDQYSFCVSLYQSLYGRWPFSTESFEALRDDVVHGRVAPAPSGSPVPTRVFKALRRGMMAEPGARFAAMTDLLAALERDPGVRYQRATVLAVTAVLAGAAGMLATAGAGSVRRWDDARRVAACEAKGAEIESAWNEQAARRLREAFVATGVSYAETTAEKVIPWLDEQAARWRQARATACIHAEVRGEWDAEILDRAEWCLEDRRLALASLVTEFERADAVVMPKAVAAAAGLRAAEDCLDEDALRRVPAPPADEREAVHELRVALSQADARSRTGKYKEALAIATAARTRAEQQLEWLPLIASARALEGALLANTGAYEAAETASTDAYFEAARAEAVDVAATTAIYLVSLMGKQRGRPADGRLWARLAEVAIAQAGDQSGLREAARLINLANTYLPTGAHAEARALLERALVLQEQALGPEHVGLTAALNNLATIHAEAGAYAEARALFERAVTIQEKALGPEHPEIANALGNLANTHISTGEYAEARALHERALAIKERTLGPEHAEVAISLNNLAILHEATGAHAETRRLHERALAIREKVFGPEHPEVAGSLVGLAAAHGNTGAYAEARGLLGRALAIQEKALGPDHPGVGFTLYNLAAAHEATGAYAEARALYERALAVQEKALGPRHPHVAHTMSGLAVVHEMTGAYAEARALYERALAVREAALGSGHPAVAADLTGLASVYLTERRPQEALPLLERALTIIDAYDGIQPREPEARFALARALVATHGDRARALAEARKAREGLREAGANATEQTAEIERWLAEHARDE